MSKISKRLLRIVLIVLISILTIALLPKYEAAESSKYYDIFLADGKSIAITDLDNYLGQTNKYLNFDGLYQFASNGLYCAEIGQRLSLKETMKVTRKIVFDGTKVTLITNSSKSGTNYYSDEIIKFAKGLAYILGKDKSMTEGGDFRVLNNWYINEKGEYIDEDRYDESYDPVQLALWKYLTDVTLTNDVKNVFGNLSQTVGALKITKTEWGTDFAIVRIKPSKYDDGSRGSPVSLTLYNGAISAMNNSTDGAFEIYYIEAVSGDKQTLVVVSTATQPDIIDTPNVTINFKKQDFSGSNLNDAKIGITANSNVLRMSANELTIGSKSLTVTPASNTGEFKLNIKENTAPSGYVKMPETVTLTVKYNTSTGAVTSISEGSDYITTSGSTVTVKNRPAVNVSFNKKDFSGNLLSGAKISITSSTGVSSLSTSTLESNAYGNFGTITVYPTDNSYNNGQFEIKVTETAAPTGYVKMPGTVTLTVKYNKTTGAVTSISEGSDYITTSGSTVTVKNNPVLNNLKIVKRDKLTNSLLPGVTFNIELTGVESITGYSGTPTTITATTGNNGEINLTGLVLAKNATEITVKITETAVPVDRNTVEEGGYYYIVDSTPIEMKLTYNNGTWLASGGQTNGTSISSDNATISGRNASITIKNQPYIKLNGMVWNDGQTGVKGNVAGPNGLKDTTERGIGGVYVQLKRTTDNTIVDDDTTDPNGNYSFIDIPYIGMVNGYKIFFSYDGINWQETKSIGSTGTHSKADEIDRTKFNNKFKTILKDQAEGDEGPTNLSYTVSAGKSTLRVNMDGTNPATGNKDFEMKAQTSSLYTTTSNIDCGLVKKEFDLALGVDVKEATLKINDKTTTYNYAQIMNGDLNADFENLSSGVNKDANNEDIVYNLYLYSSDYNYRINDYKTDIETNNKVNQEKPEGGYVATDGDTDTDTIKELEVYVTYSVVLKAQTTQNATVDEFKYYYQGQIYEPTFKKGDIIDGYEVDSIDNENYIITFVTNNNELSADNDYRKEVNLTFKVKEDYANNKKVIHDYPDNVNWAEITRYSTIEGGLIDKDSQPANVSDQYEDDSDEAKGLDIVLRTDETRIIKGTVFDDTYLNETEYDKDGILNNSNSAVNDVIVQLIEIKKIGGVYYEYIWQETRSGSNQVKTTARNGYTGTTYTNNVKAGTPEGNGMYEFKYFIPGNYIIRYIYGDGRTLDVNSDAYKNTAQYNGQDYKSTIDPNYKATWYNTSTYENGASVARDNEARRLEVMSYSGSVINKEIGEELAEKTTLDKTWMCAETSRINIPVDSDNTDTDSKTTTASYRYIKDNEKVLFGDMNFGLALRPKTKLVLEKHITGLKITPNGTGVQSIVDAKAKSIESIVNGENIEVEGVTDGLATIKSTRENRGFWQVATDVEELMQGAELEVEYTYVIRNDGEEDYLSDYVVHLYSLKDYQTYNSTLIEFVDYDIKPSMRSGTYSYSNNNTIGNYLGQVYYRGLNSDGSVPETDALVPARVETFEEALNNDLTFDTSDATYFEKTNDTAVEKDIYDVSGERKKQEINTVVQNTSVSAFLLPKSGDVYEAQTEDRMGSADWSKTISLRTTLATVTGGELGAVLPSYIAEITSYSNAAGRRDMNAIPGNLSYVHSNDETKTMETAPNEEDEFWGEKIIITEPTGEDKLTPIQIAIITISSLAVLGVGIVLIKKFVLKK